MTHFKFLSCILYLVFLIVFNILLGKVNKVKHCIIILYDQIVCCDLLDCCKQIFPNNSYLTPFFSFVTSNKGRQGLWVISARNINKTTFFYLLICQLNLQLSKFWNLPVNPQQTNLPFVVLYLAVCAVLCSALPMCCSTVLWCDAKNVTVLRCILLCCVELWRCVV